MSKLFFSFILLLFVSPLMMTGCSTGQCSNIPARPSPEETKAATQSVDMNTTEISEEKKTAAPATANKTPTMPTVLVAKDTGEKQCGMGKATSLESVKAILEKKHIKVFEAHTQDDGMMHMQLCGASSGQLHVFTIAKSNLKKASGLGFKLFKAPPKNPEN